MNVRIHRYMLSCSHCRWQVSHSGSKPSVVIVSDLCIGASSARSSCSYIGHTHTESRSTSHSQDALGGIIRPQTRTPRCWSLQGSDAFSFLDKRHRLFPSKRQTT